MTFEHWQITNHKFPAYRQAGKSQTNSKLQFQMIEMILFGIWSLELICHLVLGIWCFLNVQIHILADKKIGISDDWGSRNRPFTLGQRGCVVSRIEWSSWALDRNYDRDRRSYHQAIHRAFSEWMLPTHPMNFLGNLSFPRSPRKGSRL
jgi:hypothetical protein